MNKKNFFWSLKENTIIIIGAAALAVGIFYVVNNPNLFTASVLSLQEKAFIVEKWRDIAYKTDNGYVDIFMSEILETPKSINFTVSFDKDTINIDPQNISGQGTRTWNNIDATSILIQSTPSENIDKSQSILMLPFTGEIKNILLSEAVATLNNNQEKDLSIGSLNETTSHSK